MTDVWHHQHWQETGIKALVKARGFIALQVHSTNTSLPRNQIPQSMGSRKSWSRSWSCCWCPCSAWTWCSWHICNLDGAGWVLNGYGWNMSLERNRQMEQVNGSGFKYHAMYSTVFVVYIVVHDFYELSLVKSDNQYYWLLIEIDTTSLNGIEWFHKAQVMPRDIV